MFNVVWPLPIVSEIKFNFTSTKMAHFVGFLGPVEVYHHRYTLPNSNLQRKYEGKYYNTHEHNSKQHWLPVNMTK